MKKILLGLILLVSSSAFSQLDSVAVEMSFISDSLITIDSMSVHQGTFQVEVEINDINDFGTIVIKLFNDSSVEPFTIFYASKEDVLAQEIFSNGKIRIDFPDLNPTIPYVVSVDIQNSSMAYLPLIEAYYQPN